MTLVLNDDQTLLKDAAHGFLTDRAPISQLRRLRDEGVDAGFDAATWQEMGQMGWPGVLAPEDHGGSAMGHVAAGVIAEEMGRTLTASPFISSAVVGVTALKEAGSAAQKTDWLTKLAAGEAVAALAVDEGRAHNPAKVDTRADRDGNGFKLSGHKTFVADGHAADVFIISARTDAGITLFLAPKSTPGVTVTRRDTVDSRGAATVTLADVRLTADAVLGEVDQGAAPLGNALTAGRGAVAAELSGAAQECLAQTAAYISERKQFGQPVGAFQALQHRAAHLYSEVELGRSIVLKALQALDAGAGDAELLVTAAKAKLGQVALLAAQEAIQMHGGVGMTDEYDIGFFIKRVRVADALYGDANFHADAFARMRGY